MASTKHCIIRPLTAMVMTLCLLLNCLPHAEASNVQDSLTVGIESVKTQVIQPLDPLERDMMSVYGLMYESLVVIDDDYMPQGCLAQSWEESGSGKTWTFYLREDVVFSDGTPMTANDVVATAEYILSRANDEASSNKGYYYNLKYFVSSITAKDDYTVVVKAARSYYGVLYAMTFPVLPAGSVSSDNPLGTGPYTLTTFEPGDYMYLQANPLWWQTQPQVQEIMVICHDSDKAVIESYEYARVDTAFTRSIAAAQYKSGSSSLSLDYRTNQLECLLMNHSNSKLASVNVRKAIRYVVNPDRIASMVYMGMVKRTDTPMIPGTWMYDTNISVTQDTAAALALLEADGWGDSNEDGTLDKLNSDGELVNLSFRLDVYEEPDNDVRVEAANMIADQLSAIGIAVTVNTMTFTGIQERLSAGSFQLAIVSYAMDVAPDPGFLLMSSNTGNYCRYRSDTMTDLCKELRTQSTPAGYQDNLWRIQQLFYEDCPFITLFYRAGAVLTRSMYTTARDVRELDLLRGISTFHN